MLNIFVRYISIYKRYLYCTAGVYSANRHVSSDDIRPKFSTPMPFSAPLGGHTQQPGPGYYNDTRQPPGFGQRYAPIRPTSKSSTQRTPFGKIVVLLIEAGVCGIVVGAA